MTGRVRVGWVRSEDFQISRVGSDQEVSNLTVQVGYLVEEVLKSYRPYLVRRFSNLTGRIGSRVFQGHGSGRIRNFAKSPGWIIGSFQKITGWVGSGQIFEHLSKNFVGVEKHWLGGEFTF